LSFVTGSDSFFSEVIVSDASEKDEVKALARRYSLTHLCSQPGRGAQLAAGAAQAAGEWILFLHSDTQLVDGWQQALAKHVDSTPHRAAVFRLAFNAPSFGARLVAGWANFRTRLFGLPYGDQGLFISNQLYQEIGGFDPHLPLMEDVDIVRKLGRERLRLLSARAVTSAEKYKKDGWFKRSLRHFKFFFLYQSGKSVRDIYQDYYR